MNDPLLFAANGSAKKESFKPEHDQMLLAICSKLPAPESGPGQFTNWHKNVFSPQCVGPYEVLLKFQTQTIFHKVKNFKWNACEVFCFLRFSKSHAKLQPLPASARCKT
jgi:hypothetical protein